MRLLLPSLLFAVVLLQASVAEAVTAKLCLRNDGEGTFSGFDLGLLADSDWNAGDITGAGPSPSTLAPGGGPTTTPSVTSTGAGSRAARSRTGTTPDWSDRRPPRAPGRRSGPRRRGASRTAWTGA